MMELQAPHPDTREHLSGFGNVDLLSKVLSDHTGSGDVAALSRIRLQTKADLLADQLAAPPFGARLRRPVADLGMIVESSGSSGGPKEVHVLSRDDERAVIAMIAAAMRELGVRSGDIAALTLPIGPAGGGLKIMLALREASAAVLRVGPLSSDDKLASIQTYGASIIVGTPAYLDTLRATLERMGIQPAGLGVRLLLVATQSMTVDWIRHTQEAWGARVHEWYGNAAGVFAMTRRCGALADDGTRGCLHWDPEQLFVEIRDGERLVGSGERGQIILTHLSNTTAPLLRYATGDEGRYVAPGDCSCGSLMPGIESGTIRRIDAMVKIRGVNVWPSVVDGVADRAGVECYWALLSTDDTGREKAVIYARPKEPGRFDPQALAGDLRKRAGVGIDVVEWNELTAPEFVRTSAAGKQMQWNDVRATSA